MKILRGIYQELMKKINTTSETVAKAQEEILNQIKPVEDDGKHRIEELQQITTIECTRNKQEVLKRLEEKHKEIQTDVSERVERVYSNLNQVDGQTKENKEKIQGLNQRERQMQEELDALRDKPCNNTHIITSENRELINFRSYRRNPMEFLKRVEETIEKNRDTRWTTVRSMIDEMFRDNHDNWWTATRPEINNTEDFKTQFRHKYWLESTQNLSLIHI